MQASGRGLCAAGEDSGAGERSAADIGCGASAVALVPRPPDGTAQFFYEAWRRYAALLRFCSGIAGRADFLGDETCQNVDAVASDLRTHLACLYVCMRWSR
eukprot:gnl/Hemi2/12647_TR4324_c0_g1_i1.p2 gnl/Hemi2/12647_TR4324_c0_g1~~gnl/Hemi2/12647_TR4324_c0_g1_i1.p2  ORF type:complete len:101 (+),score=7.84 gnl/Hemi2/12647_TR4324_c0_g1_i1:54-356(+)